MKKIILLIAILILSVMFSGCEMRTVYRGVEAESGRFVIVDGTPYGNVIYDSETKVMYHVTTAGYNYGYFCLLVNADGTPKLWGWE